MTNHARPRDTLFLISLQQRRSTITVPREAPDPLAAFLWPISRLSRPRRRRTPRRQRRRRRRSLPAQLVGRRGQPVPAQAQRQPPPLLWPQRIVVTAVLGVCRGSNVELLIEQVTGSHDYRSEGLSTVRYSVRSEEVRKVGSHAYTHLLLDF